MRGRHAEAAGFSHQNVRVQQVVKWAEPRQPVFKHVGNHPIAQAQTQDQHGREQTPANATLPDQPHEDEQDERDKTRRVAGQRHDLVKHTVTQGVIDQPEERVIARLEPVNHQSVHHQ